MARFQELLRAANNLRLLAAIGRSGGELSSVADLIDSFLDSPQLAACVERFKAVPGGAAMLEERYPPLQPDIDALGQLPAGTLGRRYADLILSLGYDPEFFRPRDVGSEGRWLTQRIATTHDIHHVVAGFGTEAAGENGVLAITAAQIGFPGYVLLTSAGQLATFRFQTERFPTISNAVAHGHAIARQASCLATVKWEEDWEKPVRQWRQELGIQDPADTEPYGLEAQLGALP
ncbi:MAG: Coq4 family protein [Cyanobacteriota bacterium]|nr:Coq4 family protein [Cyanobacteriota bacterium]